jgi:RimJ/RimL family protein N-acetyltransferase
VSEKLDDTDEGGRKDNVSEDMHPMNEADAREIALWDYPPPYDLYNLDPKEIEGHVVALMDPENHYYSVRDKEGKLIAFICYGPDARVPGGDYSSDALDVGCGLRPDLTGQGLGPDVIRTAVEFGRDTWHPSRFRATIAAFNERAQKAAQRVGFQQVSSFERPSDGLPFVILEREA